MTLRRQPRLARRRFSVHGNGTCCCRGSTSRPLKIATCVREVKHSYSIFPQLPALRLSFPARSRIANCPDLNGLRFSEATSTQKDEALYVDCADNAASVCRLLYVNRRRRGLQNLGAC